MRIIDELPKPERVSLRRDLEIGTVLIHKRSGREWTIKQHWRKDQTVLIVGPGVGSPLTLTYADIRRNWNLGNSN